MEKSPIYDSKEKLRVAEGEAISVEDILTIYGLVKGVNGTIPK